MPALLPSPTKRHGKCVVTMFALLVTPPLLGQTEYTLKDPFTNPPVVLANHPGRPPSQDEISAETKARLEELKRQIGDKWGLYSQNLSPSRIIPNALIKLSADSGSPNAAVAQDPTSQDLPPYDDPFASSPDDPFAFNTAGGVQLVRGAEVLEISLDALQRSGLLETAIDASPELTVSFQNYARTKFIANQWPREENALENQIQIKKARVTNIKNDRRLSDEDRNRLLAEVQFELENDQELKSAIAVQRQQANSALATASTSFATSVQQIGLNGGQVASVNSDGNITRQAATGFMGSSQTQLDGQRHVLLQSNGGLGQSNLGYSTTRIYSNGQFGATNVPSEYLLPTPSDANDVFCAGQPGIQRLQDGTMLKITDDHKINPIARINLMPRFGVYYDTSAAPTGGNFAQGVNLLGRNAPTAGQTGFFQVGGSAQTDLDLLFDAQLLSVGGQTVQVFADTNNDLDVDSLDVEHLGFRSYNRNEGSVFEGWSLAIAQTHSLFSQVSFRPDNLQAGGSLIGTDERPNNNLPQLALNIPVTHSLKWRIGVERPYFADTATNPASNHVATLTRWPTLATNVEIGQPECPSSIQFGSICRSLGYENNMGQEHFGSAWGLAATGRIADNCGRSFFFGASGGEGVGDYIQGVSNSVIFSPTSVDAITGYGTYLGFQNVRRNPLGKSVDEFNVVYGYSWMDTPAVLGPNVNEKLQQGWFNYVRFLSDYMAVGVQYEYGYRRIAAGDSGEDNRFLVFVSLKTGPARQSTQVAANTMSLSTYRVNGNTVEQAVQQTQKGGAAYLQKF